MHSDALVFLAAKHHNASQCSIARQNSHAKGESDDRQHAGTLPANWNLNDGTLPFHYIKLYANGWQGRQDVTEHDDAVWLERSPGLQRQLDSYVCRL